MFPALFLSHGSPMLALTDAPARNFLLGLGRTLGKPSAVIVASAHWDTPVPTFSSVAVNQTIHDFYGFPPALYELRYEPPGAPALAAKAAALLGDADLAAELDDARGLDHGAWVPLSLMYPAADIPVLQVGLPSDLGPRHQLRVGQALAPLRAENVLLIGSGSFTHNLTRLRREPADGPQPADVVAFGDWFDTAIRTGAVEAMLHYREQAPFAARQHPTEEHLLPLFFAMGAAGGHAKADRLHSSAMYSSLRMDAFAFHA